MFDTLLFIHPGSVQTNSYKRHYLDTFCSGGWVLTNNWNVEGIVLLVELEDRRVGGAEIGQSCLDTTIDKTTRGSVLK